MTYPLSEIEGLTAYSASKLKSLGIRTTEALLEAARTVRGRKSLAARTGISEQQLLEWANFSDYMRIPGMGKAKVGLVRAAGVTTVRELALRNPARLAQNMKDVNTRRKLVRVLPSEKSVEQLMAQARKRIADGADIIDIGAESTRPYGGSQPVSAEEEFRRLQPVLAGVVSLGVPVSIDSMKSEIVAWALDTGAAIANDVWGLQRDAGMARLLAERKAPVVVMHNRDSADPAIDIMQDIAAFFARSLEIAAKARIA